MTEAQHTQSLSFPRLVSVIIPARNAARMLPGQLEALSRQKYQGPWEVIVVDNGSTDGTAELARRWTGKVPRLEVISVARPGVNYARNAGAAASHGDFLAFCDADDVAAPNWLDAMVAAARTADVVGGHLELDALNTPRVRFTHSMLPPDRLPVIMDFLPYAVGANMGVRADVLTALGGFDPRYAHGGGDDVEFSLRAQLSSYSIAFAPDAVVHYRLRARSWSMAKQQFKHGRADIQLVCDFRAHGMPAEPVSVAAAEWWRLVRRLPDLVSRDRLLNWIRDAAYSAGRVAGNLRYRVWRPRPGVWPRRPT
ncbi:glycosyltransferase [Saccharopolyspora phatthalungensis]|uniref:Glycosyltransferase involved in cell wall biosynthesis n=1 Tax=Saccharopolyspora phatthalungensis TaxID=664693 RepID=A0A840QB77_9PSEU|nr:glycosyltransferase [Saccharopolyspora phatthalungensis]MBB5157060.1 glycosyltransferase involved in cell wall biosynthesis [Saccharopolyspora phatthalungensis]